ncbi:hypothetical protein STEG23_022078 [Scotinomys teguina]
MEMLCLLQSGQGGKSDVTLNISYRVKKGTSTESSPETPMSTLPRRDMESIGLGMARTGGMVVITVLLSVAMFLLVVGLIIALALGARK